MQPCTRIGPPARLAGVPSTAMTSFAYVFPGQGSQSVGMGRELAERSAGARADLRGSRCRPRRDAGRAHLGRAGRTARSHRERTAGHPRDLDRDPDRDARGVGRRRGPRTAPRLRRRALDGPVLGARRGRRALARRWHPPRARAGPPHAGVRWRTGRRDGRAHRTRRRPPARACRRRRGARHVRRREPQRARPGGRVGRPARRRGRRRACHGRSARSAPSSCPSRSPPTHR